MTPDNEYFWIDPEEVRALAPLSKKRAGSSAKDRPLVTEPWLKKPVAPELAAPIPEGEGMDLEDEGDAPPAPPQQTPETAPARDRSPVPVVEASTTPYTPPIAEQNHSNALQLGAASFQARTPDERLEEFVEWLVRRYPGAAVMILSGTRQLVTAREASPELIWQAADALPEVLGARVPTHDPSAGAVRIARITPLSRAIGGPAPDHPGRLTTFIPLFCEPAGTVLCLVISGAEDPGKPSAESEGLQRIFAQLAEAMARG